MINRTLKLLTVAAFAASTVSVGGAATADVEAQGWRIEEERGPNDGDAGGVSLRDELVNADFEDVEAHFAAKDEYLSVDDDFDNDRNTVARLWVGGSGPAVFYSQGGDWTGFDLSYDEGQTVKLQVCTSASPNAVCTHVHGVTGRT